MRASEEERRVREGVSTGNSLERKAGPELFTAMKHVQVPLYLIRSEM